VKNEGSWDRQTDRQTDRRTDGRIAALFNNAIEKPGGDTYNIGMTMPLATAEPAAQQQRTK